MLYSIPRYIKISDLNAKQYKRLPARQQDAVAILKDDYSDRNFFINATTKMFLEKFRTAKNFISVNKEIAAEINVKVEEIRRYTAPFFDHLKKMGFIVKEGSSVNLKARARFNKNKHLDEYKIEKCLDATLDTDIYIARENGSQKKVIIKLLKQPGKADHDQFKREYDFLHILTNSGVTPKVYAFKKEKTYRYFVQEYIRGLALNDYLRLYPKMRLQTFIKIAGSLIYSFKEIHNNGIVHGDIHPGNIFISTGKQVKLIDFGLALRHTLECNEMVDHGGVYFYMPPERINNTTHQKFLKQPDFFSDIFQVGVVLYGMLYNKYPFNGITWEELALEIKEKEPVFKDASIFGFTVPECIKQLMQKCLSKNPEQRFPDAAQLHKAFQKNIIHVSKI